MTVPAKRLDSTFVDRADPGLGGVAPMRGRVLLVKPELPRGRQHFVSTRDYDRRLTMRRNPSDGFEVQRVVLRIQRETPFERRDEIRREPARDVPRTSASAADA